MKVRPWAEVSGLIALIRSNFWHLLQLLPLSGTIGICVPVRAAEDREVPLASVDAHRMSGDWYIVATIPNFMERGVVAGHDVFTLQPEGYFREDFYMKRGGFTGKTIHASTKITILPNTGNADWRVHIFGLIILPFQVLYVDPDYKFALFGEQNRKWGWIYSRTQTITDADYEALLLRFKALGYDSGKFRKFVQLPDQVGKPGFWSDGIRVGASKGMECSFLSLF